MNLSPNYACANVRASMKKNDASYNFSDLCGALNWKGDAVIAQRSLRDEW